MSWCYAAASVIGLSHLRAGIRLQDAKRCFVVDSNGADAHRFFAIVSDGAGSAEFGGQGASIVCRTFANLAAQEFRKNDGLPNDAIVWSWLDAARDRIQLAATRRGRVARDFASTLVLVMISADDLITAHVGDGAIVARNTLDRTWTVLSGPHNGEYASTTFFVTEDPQPALRIARYQNQYDAVACFSDGIENLVLDATTGTPSAAFFNPMARPLEASLAHGEDASLSRSLATFLGSGRVNERTDDDKTLIVAVNK